MEGTQERQSFSTFRKTYALLANPGTDTVFLSFRMNPDPKNGKHFPKETQKTFSLGQLELLEFVKVMDSLLKGKSVKKDWIHDPGAGTENAGAEIKTLSLGQTEDGSIMIRLHTKTKEEQHSYTIVFNKLEAMQLNLMLKLWFYEMITGTKVGFSYNWI